MSQPAPMPGPRTRAEMPGAVPCGLSSSRADGGRSAWRRLSSGIARPLRSNQSRRCSTPAGSRTSAAPGSTTSPSDSRVRSSSVGPSPPVMTIAACVADSSRSVRARAARSSATARRSPGIAPIRCSSRAIHEALVSSICPRMISSPTETIATTACAAPPLTRLSHATARRCAGTAPSRTHRSAGGVHPRSRHPRARVQRTSSCP